ncbi:MAG TPA: hypothetical protein VGA77_02775, partial [Propylenella sp.]
MTFEKTPSSPTYTAVGQIITYSYFLENTSQSGIFQISIDDDTIPTVDCPDDELAPGESMTCTGEYEIQPGDIGGSVTNIAIASGA